MAYIARMVQRRAGRQKNAQIDVTDHRLVEAGKCQRRNGKPGQRNLQFPGGLKTILQRTQAQ
jgi:hypothetical protein